MRSKILNYLDDQFIFPIRDPLWKHIYMTKGHREIINHKDFRYLGGLRQLGPASNLYPGAIHTRLNHSIGVFFLARQMIKAIVASEKCPELSLEGVKAFLSAALLHDIGHFPHAHAFQDFPLRDHEELSGEIIREGSIKKAIKDAAFTDPYLTAAIIDKNSGYNDNKEIVFFRNLLSSPIDPDKLDYLNRDAYFCGVPYGIQDIDFVISQIYPTENGIAVSNKGISALENVLFSKYLMYKTVYWHKSVRISTALIRKAVYIALKQGLLKGETLYKMNDYEFHSFCSNSKEEVLSLVTKAELPWRYKVIEDICFNKQNPLHDKLTNTEYKSEMENEINAKISDAIGIKQGKYDILLDVPSKISFELPFKSDTVFTRPVVDGFTESLRRIRLIVPEETAEILGIKKIDIQRLTGLT